MNERIKRLRDRSFEAVPCVSIERALLETEFYKEKFGKYSTPVMRAMFFKYLCEKKTIYIGQDELIVGERGPEPKSVPTFPELTCHSGEDLKILNTREMTPFKISEADINIYETRVIPYWKGRSMRERVFGQVPEQWSAAYQAGLFTEFMEQRAPGHTTLDDIIYRKGMLDFKQEIAQSMLALDYLNDPEASDKAEQLKAMDIACDAAVIFAERHADLAEQMARTEEDAVRKEELAEASPASAAGCRPMPRGISGRRCRCTGLSTWVPSRNSTAGIP